MLIKIAYRINKGTGNDEMMFGMEGTNYRLISYNHGNWNHKRRTHVPLNRWISRGSISISIYRTPMHAPGHIMEIKKGVVRKILSNYRAYLEKCGIKNFRRIEDVILD